MKPYHFTHPPRSLRKARLDNLALVPASLLPYKNQWQRLANGLPEGDILICLPPTQNRQRKALETVASLLESEGHRVTTIPAEQFAGM